MEAFEALFYENFIRFAYDVSKRDQYGANADIFRTLQKDSQENYPKNFMRISINIANALHQCLYKQITPDEDKQLRALFPLLDNATTSKELSEICYKALEIMKNHIKR